MMEFQEAIVDAVSSGFPYVFIMNLPYTSFTSLVESLHRSLAKRQLATLYMLAAPHGDGKLTKVLLEEYQEELTTYTTYADKEAVKADVAAFNDYLGGLK